MNKNVWKYYGIALLAVVLDQALKLWVYFHMKLGVLGQIKILGNWVKLFYTLNPGMAFGIQFGFAYDKVLLTIIRIIATILIIRYIWKLARQEQAPKWLLWGWALILGGAAGNGVDSIFYGRLLGNAPFGAPITWFYGQVIDMLYIDVWSGRLPTWIPWFGGNFVTCLPIFNLADVAILAGVGLVVIASKRQHTQAVGRKIEWEEPAT
jgi:signal peptidase II